MAAGTGSCCCGDESPPNPSSISFTPTNCGDICARWSTSCSCLFSGVSTLTLDWLPGITQTYCTLSATVPASWGGSYSFSNLCCTLNVSGDTITASRVYTSDGKQAYFEWKIFNTTTGPYTDYLTYTATLVSMRIVTPDKEISLRWVQNGSCTARLLVSDASQANVSGWCNSGVSVSEVYQLHWLRTIDTLPSTVSGSTNKAGYGDTEMCRFCFTNVFPCNICSNTKTSWYDDTGGTWVLPLLSTSQIDSVIMSATYRYGRDHLLPGGSFTPTTNTAGIADTVLLTEFLFDLTPKTSLNPLVRKQVMRASMICRSKNCNNDTSCGSSVNFDMNVYRYTFNPTEIQSEFGYSYSQAPSASYARGTLICTGSGQVPCYSPPSSVSYPCSSVTDNWGLTNRCQCSTISGLLECRDNGLVVLGASGPPGTFNWTSSLS